MNEVHIKAVKTVSELAGAVERLVEQHKIEYMDAVLLYCEQNGMDVEAAGDMIRSHQPLRLKIQQEAEQKNFLPKTARLPV